MAEEKEPEYTLEVLVRDWCPDIDTIIDADGIERRVDKDAIITLPTPEQIQREGAVIINIPTLP